MYKSESDFPREVEKESNSLGGFSLLQVPLERKSKWTEFSSYPPLYVPAKCSSIVPCHWMDRRVTSGVLYAEGTQRMLCCSPVSLGTRMMLTCGNVNSRTYLLCKLGGRVEGFQGVKDTLLGSEEGK